MFTKIYRLHEKCTLENSIDEVWQFFSNPQNLKIITPEFLNFKFISGAEEPNIYQGKIIEYRVHPILGIPMQWVTEITACKEKEYFVDEQRFGPYKFWHHQHHFKQTANGTVVEDLVHYAMPLGVLAHLPHEFIVKRQLRTIFGYRREKLGELFKVL